LRISPSGRYFAVVVESSDPRRHRIEIYRTGSQTPVVAQGSRLAKDFTFLLDDTALAYVHNNDILIMETETGRLRHQLSGHMDSIRDLESSPDGSMLISVSDDRTIAVWSAEAGRQLWSGLAHDNRVAAVAFHPFLPTLATVGEDAVLRFWRTTPMNAETGLQLAGEYHLDEGAVSQVEFSQDGRHLAIRHHHHRISWLSADLDEDPLPAGN